jgi:hypothetical protein
MSAAMDDVDHGMKRDALRARVYELTSRFGVP